MIIQHINGCTYDSITINDTETVDLPIDQVKAAIKALVDKEEDLAVLQQILISIVDSNGEYKDLGHCETCGDDVVEYTLEIPDE